MSTAWDVREILAAIRAAVLRSLSKNGLLWGHCEIPSFLIPRPRHIVPIATGRAAGAAVEDLEQVATAILLVSLALRIADDCADRDSPDALDQEIGLGRAVNAALALNAIGAREFSRKRLFQDEMIGSYYRSFLQVCQGQDRDIDKRVDSLAGYEEIVRLKTVAAYEFAAVVGARVASSDPDTIARCSQCGVHLGWMAQILDDIEALWFPDMGSGSEIEKLTFPVLLGLTLDHPNAQSLGELCRAKEYDRARICTLLDEMNVRTQLMNAALDHRDAAIKALGGSFNPEGVAILKLWLDWLLRDGARLLSQAKDVLA
jgi:geranylgeranyl pyrophosphate synthase